MKRNNRELLIFIILIPIFLWVAFYISSRVENNLPAYSVLNKSGSGFSVFYEALSELKYPVSKEMQAVEKSGKDNVQVIAQGGSFLVDSDEIKEWVGNGGVLIYLAYENIIPLGYGTIDRNNGKLTIYKYQDGKVIEAKASQFTNRVLSKDTSTAYALVEELSNLKYTRLYFNEYYMYSEANKQTLWSIIPIEIKLIFYQFLLAIAVFFFYKGKRFGRPLPLYEEVERSENEYLHSVAALYRQAKCYDLILDNYYKNFLSELKSPDEDWIDYWEREKLDKLEKAREVFIYMKGPRDKLKKKEYLHIINILDELKAILHKRSGLHWKKIAGIS